MAAPKPLSVQLYSLRDASAQDFPGVLKRVAAMGYQGVEPAGFYGLTAAEVAKIVKDLGMTVSSTHSPWAGPANAQEVIDAAGVLGTRLVIGGFGPPDFADEAAIRKTADTVAAIRAPLAKAGLTLLLHNHWWEFERLADGRLKYEVFAGLCPEVAFELDTYWAANFGANRAPEMVAKFASRCPLLHIKDGTFERDTPMTAVGAGKNDIPGIVGAADPAVLQWLVVEADAYAGDMFECIGQSYTYLTRNKLAAGNK
ncbi:MAG: sugar phosphate isomerase/epimerase [Lentisphaeria bacterium]